jgi:hypothetical protein
MKNPEESIAPCAGSFMMFPQVNQPTRIFMTTRGEGKIGRVVMTVAMIAAVAVIVLALVMVIGLTVRRHFRGASLKHREVPPQSSIRSNASLHRNPGQPDDHPARLLRALH